jgi:hypothetical protein
MIRDLRFFSARRHSASTRRAANLPAAGPFRNHAGKLLRERRPQAEAAPPLLPAVTNGSPAGSRSLEAAGRRNSAGGGHRGGGGTHRHAAGPSSRKFRGPLTRISPMGARFSNAWQIFRMWGRIESVKLGCIRITFR